MRLGEIADAVAEAIREDNSGREVVVEEHASYVRIKVPGECILRFETVSDMLGRDVAASDIEVNMPSFEGFIRTDTDHMRWVAT
ncbi:MAG: monooxygenase [Alphaproteobacteria bacterium]|nr:monooxygenase [Alphaproteobacteria bacterium]